MQKTPDLATYATPLGRPCGLNANWNCRAWQLTDGALNRISGAVYLLDDEEAFDQPAALIVQRFYGDDVIGDDVIYTLAEVGPRDMPLLGAHVRAARSLLRTFDDEDTRQAEFVLRLAIESAV